MSYIVKYRLCFHRPIFLFALLFSLITSSAYASEHHVMVIVSDRSAPTLVSGAHQLLQQQPDADIQIRTVSQLNALTDADLQQLIDNSASILVVGVFGDPVERLLVRQYNNDQS
ncbi:MAG TPA: hypothetical protein DEQ25_08320, partial [Methylophaga sp.]|nr:hypothetical protein [Methylophaga sp.]